VIGQASSDPCGWCVCWGVLMTPTPATCRSVLLLRVIWRRGAMLMTAISAGTPGRQCVQSRKVLSRRTARCASSTLATCPSLIDYTESVHRNTVVIMVVMKLKLTYLLSEYRKIL